MASVDVAIDGALARITLNRPEKLNALSGEMIGQLHAALAEIEAAAGVQGVVITGAGPRAFSVGKDLEDDGDRQDRAAAQAVVETLQEVTRRIVTSDKLYLAAVNGWAVGAGFEIALNCDLSIWAEGARAFMPELTWGLYPTGGSTASIARRAGAYAAFELMLLQEKIPARRLQEMGLAWRVVPDEYLLAEAEAVARVVADLPARRVADLKAAINRTIYGAVDEVLADETRALVEALMDPDTARRMKRYGE
jgi:enoyl-CoA hydratase/carnithine racemase